MSQAATSSNIDMLLSGLKVAAQTLHESLKVVVSEKKEPPPLQMRSSKQEIVHVLMNEVERRYGIAPGDQVERKLVRIFGQMSCEDLDRWSQGLLSTQAIEAEWLSLVECLTVHETYFDRDKVQLNIVYSDILPRLIEQKHRSGDYHIRIWSAGCSSGEEAFNLSMLALMAMKNAGFAIERSDGSILPLPSWDISVLGSDISSQMIRTAKEGIYPVIKMGSFREMNPLLWRFFDQLNSQGEGAEYGRIMRIKPCVAGITRFRRHNLLEPLQEITPFDLILCRNVLIYFNLKTAVGCV
jgi:chemotaxis protein methyltransferase CheR